MSGRSALVHSQPPLDVGSAAKVTPDVSRIVNFIRKLDRLFRASRLTTRSWTRVSLISNLKLLKEPKYMSHPALRDADVLEKVYEESRILDLYHAMLVEDGFFSESEGYIAHVFSEIGAIGATIAGYQYQRLADRMVYHASSMWKHLWTHRRALLNNRALDSTPIKLDKLPPETIITYPADLPETFNLNSKSQELQSGSSDRLYLIMLMYGWAGLYKMRPDAAVSPYHRHLTLYYWICMTNHVDISTPQGDTLRPVLTCLQNIKEDSTKDALVREVFASGTGIDPAAFCIRINQHASRVAVTLNVRTPPGEDQTGLEMLFALQDLACHPLIFPSVAKYACHEASVRMTSQVLRSGIVSDPYTEFLLWYTSHMLSQRIMAYVHRTKSQNDSDTMRTLTSFFRGEDLIEELARGIDLLARRGTDLGPNYHSYPRESQLPSALTGRIKSVQELVVLTRFNAHAGRPFLESMKHGAHQAWWPTLRNIQKAAYLAPEATDRAVNMDISRQWSQVGAALGLSEEKERKRHEREASRRCAWAGCGLHWSTPDVSIKLKTCRGCGEVSYCGRGCQKTDWNQGRHKDKCRNRLKS
ncbi:unnamed protein product [Peniophora sp. CBMAI 1063]|nr:unnamed protein product [Peniophora sp. CBMAI 1063]